MHQLVLRICTVFGVTRIIVYRTKVRSFAWKVALYLLCIAKPSLNLTLHTYTPLHAYKHGTVVAT